MWTGTSDGQLQEKEKEKEEKEVQEKEKEDVVLECEASNGQLRKGEK